MELFTSGDESQMEVIKQWIDESDVYLVILAGRYGSVEPKTGKSYTQLEYEYALEKGKPLFACAINDAALENRVKAHGISVIETDNSQKLKDFRELVLSKTVRFWDDSKDIKISIGETLAHFSRRDDLNGWVRSQEEADMPALADEIARLSKENARLRSQVEGSRTEPSVDGLGFHELKAILENKGLLNVLIENRSTFAKNFTLNQLHLSPPSLNELLVLGVVERVSGATYCLTPAGRVFINRMEAKRLMSQDEQ